MITRWLLLFLLITLATGFRYKGGYRKGSYKKYGVGRPSYNKKVPSYGKKVPTYGNSYGNKYVYSKKPVRLIPRCTTSKTWVDIVVVGPDGAGCANALVYYVDDSIMRKVHTDYNGKSKVLISGCKISLIVTAKDVQPAYKTHTLYNCKGDTEQIVIQQYTKCNYKVYFYNINDYYNGGDLVNCVWTSHDGSSSGEKQTGTGVAVAYKSPLCVNWEYVADSDTGSLKVIGTAQSSTEIFLLHVTRQDTAVAVNIPPLVKDKYCYLVCFNLWQKGYAYSGLYYISNPQVLSTDGADDVYLHEDGNCFWFDDLDKDKDYVIATQFEGKDGTYLEGNAQVVDSHGRCNTEEIPYASYTAYHWWRVWCICKGNKDAKKLKAVNDGGFDAGNSYYLDPTVCHEICNPGAPPS
eukprot:TRINITY_DN196_c0_g1_i1.p1 TRINITY_DN196_c0_g1~~TRINITY_DN196_c0_g1_i1.p1  ORF type:complete len:407 (+),score=44.83 TRINITY_DN196_c0_g1_i1:37-1257(+)